jgi:Mn-containing catalase
MEVELGKGKDLIIRIDKLQIEMPMPEDPAPEAANAVQELLGGRFGEMSTLMNYTFQSFNFRGRKKVKPYYDLIANIATEEYGHVELVAATINGMLTGAPADDSEDGEMDPTTLPLASVLGVGNPHHFGNNGGSALVSNALGKPGRGTTSSILGTSCSTSCTTSSSSRVPEWARSGSTR